MNIVGDPTLADAILDRVIHNAYRIDLAGESLRKAKEQALSPLQSHSPNPRMVVSHERAQGLPRG